MRILLAISFLGLAGCYSYAPAPVPGLARGAAVRVHMTTPFDLRITQVTVNDVAMVDGEVIGFTADTLALSAWWLQGASGFDYPAAGETLRIPGDRIGRVEKRRLSAVRSAGLAGAVAGITTLLVATLNAAGVFGGPGAPGGSPK